MTDSDIIQITEINQFFMAIGVVVVVILIAAVVYLAWQTYSYELLVKRSIKETHKRTRK